jgi:hypothetical protein
VGANLAMSLNGPEVLYGAVNGFPHVVTAEQNILLQEYFLWQSR